MQWTKDNDNETESKEIFLNMKNISKYKAHENQGWQQNNVMFNFCNFYRDTEQDFLCNSYAYQGSSYDVI